jgi:FixJ family two-component response regulator
MNLTERQERILKAIAQGHVTARDIAKAADISSTSVVAHNLRRLAAGEHVLLRKTRRGMVVATGNDFCAGWDAAARLAGNEDA